MICKYIVLIFSNRTQLNNFNQKIVQLLYSFRKDALIIEGRDTSVSRYLKEVFMMPIYMFTNKRYESHCRNNVGARSKV